MGGIAWGGKRDTPQTIPDERIVKMDEEFNLRDKSVLEVGCYEGIHTSALCARANKVFAIDARVENVIKTVVRCNLLGYQPIVGVCNLELSEHFETLPKVHFVHHVGVLYHLNDPVKHLFQLKDVIKIGMMLDTHYATEGMLNSSYEYQDKEYRCYNYPERGRDDVFSGTNDFSRWLLKEDIINILKEIGLSNVKIISDEEQRNGPRFTLLV
jgi:tRNA (mo5U34)-methyltransferase